LRSHPRPNQESTMPEDYLTHEAFADPDPEPADEGDAPPVE
jgi:hypothetical protein